MANSDSDQTASLMTPAKLKQAAGRRAAADVSPSAYLDKMAADAGHQHLHRLAELVAALQVHTAARQARTPASALAQLDQALAQVDFGLLQTRSWWARTTGKSKSAGEQFAAQYEQAQDAALALGRQAQELAARQQQDASATERALVEFEVEFHALGKIVEQGARWLQDMRNQLKARHAAATDPQVQQQVKDDAARCEILVVRLKMLRAVAAAAQQVQQQAQAATAQRTSLLGLLRQALASDVRAWQLRLSPLVSSAGAASAPGLSLEGPMESQRELQVRVAQAVAESAAQRVSEEALSSSLAALGSQLQSGT